MHKIELEGYSWYVGDQYADDGMAPSGHEEILEPVFRELLGNGVFLDIGAHAGHWVIRMAGQAEKVIAVEAREDTADLLQRNIEANGFGNVTVIRAAAWDSNEMLSLEDPKDRIRSATTRTLPSKKGEVRGQLIDDLLKGEEKITLVKIDVEGADCHVLRGMRQTLARCKPVMIVERHDFYGYYTKEELFDTLSDLRYKWRDAPLYYGEPHLICEPLDA